MEEIKLSFIVPIYNAAEYIEKCILSIMNQTYDNFEVILIDDGSRDNSFEIICQLAAKYKNLIAITQENGGPSKARNKGLELATGNYMAFVDADDYIDNDFALKMVGATHDGKSDLVVCNYTEINKLGAIDVKIFKELEGNFFEGNELCLKEILMGPGGLVWGKLFKRSIIERGKVRFNENYKMCEDLLFCLEYIESVKYVSQSIEHLYLHNKCNENSITAGYTSNMFYKQLQVQEDIEDLLKNSGLYNNYTKVMMLNRLKNILEYSIERECNDRNKKSLVYKIKSINYIIKDKKVSGYVKDLQGEGPIDKAIVKFIKNQNSIMLYLAVKLRYLVVYIYSKVKKVRRRKSANAT